jgi:hypothetical protein
LSKSNQSEEPPTSTLVGRFGSGGSPAGAVVLFDLLVQEPGGLGSNTADVVVNEGNHMPGVRIEIHVNRGLC